MRTALASAFLAAAFATPSAQSPAASRTPKPNYELAADWTAQKVGRLVFDTSVTPRWLETSDRFWYAYQTRDGRKFWIVDPLKKAKAPLFDHAKMAATLTSITREPYDAQHLPFSTVRFVKKDAAFQFDVQVPRDADVVKPKRPTTTSSSLAARLTRGGSLDTLETNPQGQRGRGANAGGRGNQPPKNRTLHFEYDMASGNVELLDDDYKGPQRPRWASVSPDGKTVVFARNHNLFMMDADGFALAQKKADDPQTGRGAGAAGEIKEVQLTTDGEENYSYARSQQQLQQEQEQQQQQQQEEGGGQQQTEDQTTADKNARTPTIQIIWSKDSRKLAFVRRDQRKVADLWVIDSLALPRPKLETYRYAMPGEANVTQYEIATIDIASQKLTKVKADKFKDQTLQIATAPVSPRFQGGRGGGGQGGGQQNPDAPPPMWLSDTSDQLYLTRQSRDLHKVDVLVASPDSGDARVLLEERLNTYIETKPLRLSNGGKDLLFWSERTGWGHYYVYDAQSGALKNALTSGEYVTTNVEVVDDKLRVAYVSAVGREAGEDPYYPHLYRVGYDGATIKLLNPGDASHDARLSESARYFVDNASRIDGEPAAFLYDTLGATVAKLDAPDLSALKDAGFKFPEPFKVKADDGVTDLYGVMYKPFDFDASKKYPIILYVYPGPQTESVTKTFNPREQSQALAQFGFIVVEVGNRGGNPLRSKWYHNYGYGNLRDYGLADKKAAVEQLARRYGYLDLDRVGIWGHSGGGFMSTAAMLVFPDFFKVAVSESGNHENNIYNNTWSEKNHGIKEVTDKDGNVSFEYSIEKNSELAKNLKGHLLLSTGEIDNNVHPANTMRLADALIKANKRFDMLVIPGVRHGYGDRSAYFNWVRADYFCRHLLGQSADSVDIVELNREKEQVGDKKPR
ncbi:MAG TPA: DPP IV N-terminal domain-containing protein [Vicinamibacterales bacterium]|nr:DPP IV N-terminal domain-containing protein [Vicinamibacterales bacterium]